MQYRFATCTDRMFIAMGSLLTVLVGASNPLMMIIFGDITGAFVDFAVVRRSSNTTEPELVDAENVFYDAITDFLINSCVLGILTLLFSYVATVLFHFTAQKQVSSPTVVLRNPKSSALF